MLKKVIALSLILVAVVAASAVALSYRRPSPSSSAATTASGLEAKLLGTAWVQLDSQGKEADEELDFNATRYDDPAGVSYDFQEYLNKRPGESGYWKANGDTITVVGNLPDITYTGVSIVGDTLIMTDSSDGILLTFKNLHGATETPNASDDVTVLPTSAGQDQTFDYPTMYPVSDESSFSDQLAAYGAAGEIWLGPKSWTGEGIVGVDGGERVTLYPVGASATSSASRISYAKEPACVGCILSEAAPYFPAAMKEWKKSFDDPNGSEILAMPGLQITNTSSPNVVRYSLPASNGFFTVGIADYASADDGSDPFFAEARVTLPKGKEKLADFLLQDFITNRLETPE